MADFRLSLTIAALIVSGVAGFACEKAPPAGFSAQSLPLPGKEELAVWGARRISLSAFDSVRVLFPSLKPDAVWALMLASFALESEPPVANPNEATPRTAAAIARVLRPLFPPEGSEKERTETLRVLNLGWGTRLESPTQARAYLDSLIRRFPLEANSHLLSEIGVTATP